MKGTQISNNFYTSVKILEDGKRFAFQRKTYTRTDMLIITNIAGENNKSPLEKQIETYLPNRIVNRQLKNNIPRLLTTNTYQNSTYKNNTYNNAIQRIASRVLDSYNNDGISEPYNKVTDNGYLDSNYRRCA